MVTTATKGSFKTTAPTAPTIATMRIGLSLLPWLLLLTLLQQQQLCECRYLPTRSHGDDLDKLRELMLQIIESSNEEQRPMPSEPNANSVGHDNLSWLKQLNAISGDATRKYAARHNYDNENGRNY